MPLVWTGLATHVIKECLLFEASQSFMEGLSVLIAVLWCSLVIMTFLANCDGVIVPFLKFIRGGQSGF